jgi:hypothetical protein
MGRKKKPEHEKATKPGVALDNDSRTILSKIMEWELAVHNNQFTASQAIRKCMRLAWQSHYEKNFAEYEAKQSMDGVALLNEQPGKDHTAAKRRTERGAGANALLPSESSVTLRSTATKTNIRRAG